MPFLLGMENTLTEDEGDEFDTLGHTKPCRGHDQEYVEADSETMELADVETVYMERPR
jgi:hypothetical protein